MVSTQRASVAVKPASFVSTIMLACEPNRTPCGTWPTGSKATRIGRRWLLDSQPAPGACTKSRARRSGSASRCRRQGPTTRPWNNRPGKTSRAISTLSPSRTLPSWFSRK